MKDITRLSGGQQQMVSIARAIAQEPDVLLLDEPTANLDIKHEIEIMELLQRFSQQGISIVIAMHDINMAIRYANRFIMLKDKTIFAEGGKEIITKKNIEKLYNIKVHLVEEEKQLFVIPNGLHK
jgi:iron complex transport system ATP-binding protein